MKLLHSADWHLSPKRDKLEESTRCIEHLVDVAEAERPDVAVIAGDLLDFHDGAIRIDSETTRAMIRLVQSLALVCPVLIVRGTPSHDREGLDFLRELWTQHPVHVATTFGQVALVKHNAVDVDGQDEEPWFTWEGLDIALHGNAERILAAFTCFPSPEKAWLMAHGMGSIREANAAAREVIHDLLAGFGLVNAGLTVPRVLVGHCMVTGARLSSGITAIGEDLELGLSDLDAAHVDYAALGHVHEHQGWTTEQGTHVRYSGSPGRLNFGETGPKGFLLVDLDTNPSAANPPVYDMRFVETPARRFVFGEATWNGDGAEGIRAEVARIAAEDLAGADVRFRYTVPEEHLHELAPDAIRAELLASGAREAKVERSIIPRERVRAAGISRLETLPEKVARWGETVATEIPAAVLSLAARIEGLDIEELAAEAMARVDHVPDAGKMVDEEDRESRELFGIRNPEPIDNVADPFAAPPSAVSVEERKERIIGGIGEFARRQEEAAAVAAAALRGPVQAEMF